MPHVMKADGSRTATVVAACVALQLALSGCGSRTRTAVALPMTLPSPDDGPVTRAQRMLCGRSPCTVWIELRGVRTRPASEIFGAMSVFDRIELEAEDEAWERTRLEIAADYYDHGHLDVEVRGPTVTPSLDGRALHVFFAVDEGPVYRIRKYTAFDDLDGLRRAPLGGWAPSLHRGDVFSRRQVMIDFEWLRRIYRDAGYGDVVAEPATELDRAHDEVTVIGRVMRRGS